MQIDTETTNLSYFDTKTNLLIKFIFNILKNILNIIYYRPASLNFNHLDTNLMLFCVVDSTNTGCAYESYTNQRYTRGRGPGRCC